MKKSLFTLLVLVVLGFSGCSSNLSMNGVSEADIKHRFQTGILDSQEKVIVAKNKLSKLAYAGGGAVIGGGAGAIIGDSTKATIIGSVVGAGVGYLASNFQETEAYLIKIRNLENNQMETAFIEIPVEVGSVVEYIKRESEITNVNVIETATQLKKRMEKELREEKRAKRMSRK